MAVTSEQHAELYSQLRAQLISRFFAFGRHFPAHHLSLWNRLASLHTEQPRDPQATRRILGRRDDPERLRPDPRIEFSTYAHSSDLTGVADARTQDLERWRVSDHTRENPLMFGCQLMLALTVEARLGHLESLVILRQAVLSLRELNHSGPTGYFMRWDAATSDHWTTERQTWKPPGEAKEREREVALWNYEFPLNSYGRPVYPVPRNHPGYEPYEDDGRARAWADARSAEISTDEIIGLVASYVFIDQVLPRDATGEAAKLIAEIRSIIKADSGVLGGYLSRNAYLLARPSGSGGFNSRGAGGSLPAFEPVLRPALERISGRSLPVTRSFEDVLGDVGLLEGFEGYFFTADVVGTAVMVVGAQLFGVVLGLGVAGATIVSQRTELLEAFVAGLGPRAGAVMARALVFLANLERFDVTDQASDLVGAYLLTQLDPELRLRVYFESMNLGDGKFARGFPPYLALCGIGEAASGAAIPAYRTHLDSPGRKSGPPGATAFFSAVGVLVGAGESEEKLLAERLERAYERFTTPPPEGLGRRLTLDDNAKGVVRESLYAGFEDQGPALALEYLASVALSWLNALYADKTPGLPRRGVSRPRKHPRSLPRPPKRLQLRPPTVPLAVMREGSNPAVESILARLVDEPGEFPTQDWRIYDVAQRPLRHVPWRPHEDGCRAWLPPELASSEREITVKESARIVKAGISVGHLDGLRIRARGRISAGYVFAGDNGPEGWSSPARARNLVDVLQDIYEIFLRSHPDHETVEVPKLSRARWPAPLWPPYCLLYRIKVKGEETPWTAVSPRGSSAVDATYTGPGGALEFRINDNVPGNGSGEFKVSVTHIRRGIGVDERHRRAFPR